MLTEEHKKKIEYLNQYKYLNKEIDRKISELENWRNKIFNVTGTLSDMPKSPNRSNVIEDGIATIDEIEASINKDIDDLIDLRNEIEGKINSVRDLKLRELLKCRYLDCQKWEEIAYRNEYSWRHVYRLHELALDEINI